MTYQRNICVSAGLLADDPLNDRLPQLVVQVEIDADDDARDQDDDRRLNYLRLPRPLDFLQLRQRLREETAAALATLYAGLTLRGRLRTNLLLALARALGDAAALLLRLAARAPLRTSLPGHQRFSKDI